MTSQKADFKRRQWWALGEVQEANSLMGLTGHVTGHVTHCPPPESSSHFLPTRSMRRRLLLLILVYLLQASHVAALEGGGATLASIDTGNQ